MASRRPRSSRLFSVISTTSMVTPASLPSKLRSDQRVSAAVSTSAAPTTQRLGKGRPLMAKCMRHNSSVADSAVHHQARLPTCGRIVQVMTSRLNKVSRASRGSCFSRGLIMWSVNSSNPQGQSLKCAAFVRVALAGGLFAAGQAQAVIQTRALGGQYPGAHA